MINVLLIAGVVGLGFALYKDMRDFMKDLL